MKYALLAGKLLLTWLLVFVVACLSELLAYGPRILELSAGEWRGVLAAGILAAAGAFIAWADPKYTRMGRGT